MRLRPFNVRGCGAGHSLISPPCWISSMREWTRFSAAITSHKEVIASHVRVWWLSQHSFRKHLILCGKPSQPLVRTRSTPELMSCPSDAALCSISETIKLRHATPVQSIAVAAFACSLVHFPLHSCLQFSLVYPHIPPAPCSVSGIRYPLHRKVARREIRGRKTAGIYTNETWQHRSAKLTTRYGG